MRIWALLLLSCLSLPLLAAPPAKIEARFDLIRNDVKLAEVSELFVRDGDHYRIKSITRPVGLLALFKPDTVQATSEGHISAQGLHPHSFSYQHTQNTHRDAEASFDWESNSLMHNDQYGRRLEALPKETQDRLSVLYQFRFIPFLRERKELLLPITNGSKMELRTYQIIPRQLLSTPLGTLETLHLSTEPTSSGRRTDIWLSIENGNFPCKIIRTEDNGEQVTQVLTSLSITQ